MDTKSILDSLMGNDRNAGKRDSKRQNFWNDDICKDFLLEGCTHGYFYNEDGKPVPKSPLGECLKVHSEAMKNRFQEDKEHKKFRYKYVTVLELKMRKLIDALNGKREMEREKLMKGESDSQVLIRSCIEAGTAAVEEKLEAAEKMAISGDVEASQSLFSTNSDRQKTLMRIKEKQEDRLEEICEICGTTMVHKTQGEKGFGTAHGHYSGNVCIGWREMRKTLAQLQKELQDTPKQDEPQVREKKEDREDVRSKRRSETDPARRDAHEEGKRSERNRDSDDRNDDRGRDRYRDGVERSRDRDRRRDKEEPKELKEKRDANDDRGRNRHRDGVERTRDRDRRRDTEEPKEEQRDAFGRSKKIAIDYFLGDTPKTGRTKDRSRSRGKKKAAPESTDDIKYVPVDWSEDWQEVMGEKFAALKLQMSAWDMTAFDCKDKPLDLEADEVQLDFDSFPILFKFLRK